MRSLLAILLLSLPGIAFADEASTIDPKADAIIANFTHFYGGVKADQVQIDRKMLTIKFSSAREVHAGYRADLKEKLTADLEAALKPMASTP